MRKIRGEVQKTANYTMSVKYASIILLLLLHHLLSQLYSVFDATPYRFRHDTIRAKQLQQPGGKEPREIVEIMELAGEMTNLREELWKFKTGPGGGRNGVGSGGGRGRDAISKRP